MINVLLVDDHRIMLEGLALLLRAQPDIAVVGEALDGAEAVERVRELRPDVVVMDVLMPDMDGVEATQIIKREWPGVRVIGLSMNKNDQTALKMYSAGAEAYLTKGGPVAVLVAVIRGEAEVHGA
ncbi:MAG: response regulator transcription factor [Phycisphaeraceae bacterium]